ncbi:uncharacterized protein EV422DRAFT_504032 [Fimicolochytrium jonesii]|uniref:uncharacterized protein n=1 Tax=Fimicolochytrium jonesii TaxID=1396493 RepID=UPI0022FDC3F2|nr:uncharacterized protein EV422DRAFT_504032 [Fimicolochytrium jonesii]KAI8825320.1 hypothetical protein EV422DRAFT_504032 [Fimicolochytrium jonesii]
MKLASAILAVVCVAFASQAEARNCIAGITYCGSTLRAIATGSNYDPVMAATGHVLGNDKFYCNDRNGGIVWLKTCRENCVDRGAAKSDYCQNEDPRPQDG